MGIHFNKAELAIVEPYTNCLGVWLGLLNDYR
jgi:hypothetical protein